MRRPPVRAGSVPRRGPVPERLALAKRFGADVVINPKQEDALAIVRGLTEGYGCDVYIEANWPRGLPEGVIHADLFPDNVFFLGDKLSGLIDFPFSCNDMLAYDVAVCLNAWAPEIFYDEVGGHDTFVRLVDAFYRGVADDEHLAAFVRTVRDTMQPFAEHGEYVGLMGPDAELGGDRAEVARLAYGREKHQRLAALKDRYDPGNLFRHNLNVAPGRR